MSLRKSPTHPPALLSANIAKARSSTCPRAPQRKSGCAFSGFRHGSRAVTLRKKRIVEADPDDPWFRWKIAQAFCLSSGSCVLQPSEVQGLAVAAGRRAWKLARLRPKPESLVLSICLGGRVYQFRIWNVCGQSGWCSAGTQEVLDGKTNAADGAEGRAHRTSSRPGSGRRLARPGTLGPDTEYMGSS